MTNKFYIDISYVCSVTKRHEHHIRQIRDESDEDFLIRKLQDAGPPVVFISLEDHPEFAKLRDELEKRGFIETKRNQWNGDSALKTFYLNDKKFTKNKRFCCAAALRYDLLK